MMLTDDDGDDINKMRTMLFIIVRTQVTRVMIITPMTTMMMMMMMMMMVMIMTFRCTQCYSS